MTVRFLVMNAGIAALYAVLTLAFAPLSYGPVQVRFSEAMTLLAFVNRKWIPGLVLGCFAANLGSPLGPVDVIFGTVATFFALWPMKYARTMWQASLMPVVANGLIIAGELVYISDIPAGAFPVTALYIGAGEFLSVTIMGQIVMRLLLSRKPVAAFLRERRL